MQKTDIRLDLLIAIGLVLFVVIFFIGCGTSAENKTDAKTDSQGIGQPSADYEKTVSFPKGALIEIKKDSAADTVKVFYDRLREKKFRDAIMLTNLRPAIEGLTNDELKELGVDFGFLAQSIPENMPINGEIVVGDKATVTVKMPDENDARIQTQEIKLRRENNNWVLLLADENGEKEAKKEGNNYFFALRMKVHHEEAKTMLERIYKAQMIYSTQNDGRFADLQTLVAKGYVPPDALGSITTGYKYDIALREDNTLFTSLATPAEYGKTGKLSFAYKVSREKRPELISKDLSGKPFKN